MADEFEPGDSRFSQEMAAMLRLAMVCTLGTVAADLASDEVSLNCGSHLGASGASDEAHKCSTAGDHRSHIFPTSKASCASSTTLAMPACRACCMYCTRSDFSVPRAFRLRKNILAGGFGSRRSCSIGTSRPFRRLLKSRCFSGSTAAPVARPSAECSSRTGRSS